MAVAKSLTQDVFLRRHGFRIHCRPKGGSATWERNNRVVFENVALELAKREEAEERKRAKEAVS